MLFVSAFWTVDSFTGKIVHIWSARQLPDDLSTTRPTAGSRCRTIGIAAAVTVTDAVLAFPFAYFMARVATPRMRALLFVLVLLPLWSSYLVRIYAWRLILAKRRARSTGRWTSIGLPDANLALHEHGDVDRLLVHLAAVHDPAGLRGARADPALATSRPRATSARAAGARSAA